MFRLGQPLQFGLLLGDPSVEIFPHKIGQLGREQPAIALIIPSMGPQGHQLALGELSIRVVAGCSRP